jgi:uncharacterized phage protein (TIGR02218 family)
VSRTIPIALQTNLSKRETTACGLLRIKPIRGAAFGFSSTNRPIVFDDGAGVLTYRSSSGYDAAAHVSTSDTAVDNTEARILLLPGTPISEAEVMAGYLDGAEFTIYEVDYEDLGAGARIVAHGRLGRPKIGKGGSVVTLELRALIDALRQTPWEKWSRLCRVRKFGSQPGEERFPCMYDLTGEWIEDVVVTSVGIENVRTFSASALAQPADYFAPGMIEWVGGDNEGISFEGSEFAAGGEVSTTFPMSYPVQVGDVFRIRRDCTREWSGHNSCETFANREWFRGEPKIRPAEAMNALVPGAGVGPGMGGIIHAAIEAAEEE